MMIAFFPGGILSPILSLCFYELSVVMAGASAAIFTLITIVMLIRPLKFSRIFLMSLGLVVILYFLLGYWRK
jgi:membrane associated rhomboid family serine protease